MLFLKDDEFTYFIESSLECTLIEQFLCTMSLCLIFRNMLSYAEGDSFSIRFRSTLPHSVLFIFFAHFSFLKFYDLTVNK